MFVIKKVRNTVPSTYVIEDLNGEEVVGTFYEKEFQRSNRVWFNLLYLKKVIKRKGDKLYPYSRWKGYNNSVNGCIDKNNIVI